MRFAQTVETRNTQVLFRDCDGQFSSCPLIGRWMFPLAFDKAVMSVMFSVSLRCNVSLVIGCRLSLPAVRGNINIGGATVRSS